MTSNPIIPGGETYEEIKENAEKKKIKVIEVVVTEVLPGGEFVYKKLTGEELTTTDVAGAAIDFIPGGKVGATGGKIIKVIKGSGEAKTLFKGIDRSNPETYYSYSDLKKLIKESELSGRGIGLEAHHLLEKQFADVLDINKGDIISVPLTPQWHRNVGSAEVQEIWQAHRNVYEKIGQPDWANAIYEAYVKKFNVPY